MRRRRQLRPYRRRKPRLAGDRPVHAARVTAVGNEQHLDPLSLRFGEPGIEFVVDDDLLCRFLGAAAIESRKLQKLVQPVGLAAGNKLRHLGTVTGIGEDDRVAFAGGADKFQPGGSDRVLGRLFVDEFADGADIRRLQRLRNVTRILDCSVEAHFMRVDIDADDKR